MSKSYFSWLTPAKKYNLNTNYNGEERAYVVTGQYEKVLPMDIYPMQLIKACMIEDIDAMEQLGIYGFRRRYGTLRICMYFQNGSPKYYS